MPRVSDMLDPEKFAAELAGAWNRINTANSPLGGADQVPDLSLDLPVRLRLAKAGLRHAQQVLGQPQWSNSQYAGQRFHPPDPDVRLAYPDGIPFSYEGFPRFDQWATHSVDLPRGFGPTREADFAKANAGAGLDSTPDGMIWHHVEDGRTMQLVPKDLHTAVGHWGGVAITKALGEWDLREQERGRHRQPSAGRDAPAQVRAATRALGSPVPTGDSARPDRAHPARSGSRERRQPAATPSPVTEGRQHARPGTTPRSHR